MAKHASPIKFDVDAKDMRRQFNRFEKDAPDYIRIALLNSMNVVGTIAVERFMEPHKVDPEEYLKRQPGQPMKSRKGGSKLGILTGRLSRSILDVPGPGGRKESIRRILGTGQTFEAEIGSEVPYAAIHEHGGTINHNNLFGRGISATINIPPRPYLNPALDASRALIHAEFQKVIKLLETKVSDV